MLTQKNLLAVLYVLVGLLGVSIVSADEPQVSYIDGATEPENIPDRVRYGMFVKRYAIDIRNHLVQKLPSQDDAILNSLAVQDEAAEQGEGVLYQKAVLNFCTSRRNKAAVSLAREVERLVEDYYVRRVNRYRQGIESLSPTGRQIVENFIENSIVPNSRAAVFDGVAWARSDPDSYLEHVDIRCHVAETGELPAEIKKQFDEYVQQRRAEFDESSKD